MQQQQNQRKYQIHLKSHSGPIYVLLVNKDTDSSSPVVVQVPPPKEDMIVPNVDNSENKDPPQKKPKVCVSGTLRYYLGEMLYMYNV